MKGVATEVILTIGVLVAACIALLQLRGVYVAQQEISIEEVVSVFAKDLDSIVDRTIATTGDAAFVYYPSIKLYRIEIKNNAVSIFDKTSGKSASFSKSAPEIIDNQFEDCEKIFVIKQKEKIVLMCKCLDLGEDCKDSLLCCSGYCNETSKKCEEMPICPRERICLGAPESRKDNLGKDCCPSDRPICTSGHCCPTDKPKWCNNPKADPPRCMDDNEIKVDCEKLKPTIPCDNIKSPSDLPPSWDWRNVDGKNWMTPVKSQGSCGSCWAFSVVGSIEGTYKIEQNNHNLNPNLSEQDLVSCSNAGSCSSGGLPYLALEYVKIHGICDEDCFPYRATDIPCNRCGGWENMLWKINDYVYATGIFEIKKRVICNGPLSVIVMPWPGSPQGHAVVLVGYDDNMADCLVGKDGGGCWIIKNSWGTRWGNGGYGTIGYGTNQMEEYGYDYYVTEVSAP